MVVTGAALYMQRRLSTPVVEASGDAGWLVKNNHAHLHQDSAPLFLPKPTVWYGGAAHRLHHGV